MPNYIINPAISAIMKNNIRLWCKKRTACDIKITVDEYNGSPRLTIYFTKDNLSIYHHDFYNVDTLIHEGINSRDFADEAIRGLKKAVLRHYFK